jgi:hypothetical protein
MCGDVASLPPLAWGHGRLPLGLWSSPQPSPGLRHPASQGHALPTTLLAPSRHGRQEEAGRSGLPRPQEIWVTHCPPGAAVLSERFLALLATWATSISSSSGESIVRVQIRIGKRACRACSPGPSRERRKPQSTTCGTKSRANTVVEISEGARCLAWFCRRAASSLPKSRTP